jgi:hypothetical protein
MKMKLDELHMHCDTCPIIDYCNDYEDTPPCEQPRFEGLEIDKFIELAEKSKCGDKNDMLDDVARMIKLESNKEGE